MKCCLFRGGHAEEVGQSVTEGVSGIRMG